MIKLLINGNEVHLSVKEAEELQIDIERQLMEHYDTLRVEQSITQSISSDILYREE